MSSSKREQERERERARFGLFIVGFPFSCLFRFSFLVFHQIGCGLNLQWHGHVPDEEDARPWHIQRSEWRSHSRKRRRHDRDDWKWQCSLCSWKCAAFGWESKPSHFPPSPLSLSPLLPCTRGSSGSADTGAGRSTTHGDAHWQPVLGGANETSREYNNTNTESSARWDKTDSALARQIRAKRNVDAANNVLTVAQQKIKDLFDGTGIAVDVAKEIVGPATGLASDVTMLLKMIAWRSLFASHHDLFRGSQASVDCFEDGYVRSSEASLFFVIQLVVIFSLVLLLLVPSGSFDQFFRCVFLSRSKSLVQCYRSRVVFFVEFPYFTRLR